jgi:hypothetical protein
MSYDGTESEVLVERSRDLVERSRGSRIPRRAGADRPEREESEADEDREPFHPAPKPFHPAPKRMQPERMFWQTPVRPPQGIPVTIAGLGDVLRPGMRRALLPASVLFLVVTACGAGPQHRRRG